MKGDFWCYRKDAEITHRIEGSLQEVRDYRTGISLHWNLLSSLLGFILYILQSDLCQKISDGCLHPNLISFWYHDNLRQDHFSFCLKLGDLFESIIIPKERRVLLFVWFGAHANPNGQERIRTYPRRCRGEFVLRPNH